MELGENDFYMLLCILYEFYSSRTYKRQSENFVKLMSRIYEFLCSSFSLYLNGIQLEF